MLWNCKFKDNPRKYVDFPGVVVCYRDSDSSINQRFPWKRLGDIPSCFLKNPG